MVAEVVDLKNFNQLSMRKAFILKAHTIYLFFEPQKGRRPVDGRRAVRSARPIFCMQL